MSAPWTADPTINQHAAQALLKIQGGGRVRIEFYLSGHPEPRWVMDESEHATFGIVFDLLGDGTRILVAEKPAKVAALATRPPAHHPGLTVRPVLLRIKVDAAVSRVYRR